MPLCSAEADYLGGFKFKSGISLLMIIIFVLCFQLSVRLRAILLSLYLGYQQVPTSISFCTYFRSEDHDFLLHHCLIQILSWKCCFDHKLYMVLLWSHSPI